MDCLLHSDILDNGDWWWDSSVERSARRLYLSSLRRLTWSIRNERLWGASIVWLHRRNHVRHHSIQHQTLHLDPVHEDLCRDSKRKLDVLEHPHCHLGQLSFLHYPHLHWDLPLSPAWEILERLDHHWALFGPKWDLHCSRSSQQFLGLRDPPATPGTDLETPDATKAQARHLCHLFDRTLVSLSTYIRHPHKSSYRCHSVCITSILRLYYTIRLAQTGDVTYNLAFMGLWTYAELSMGVVCACLPATPRFFKEVRERLSTLRSSSSYPRTTFFGLKSKQHHDQSSEENSEV